MIDSAKVAAVAFAAGVVIALVADATNRNLPVLDTASVGGAHRLAVRSGEYGNCYVDGFGNDAPFTFEIDTGAGGLVFARNHVRQLGLNPAALRFDQPYSSANGDGREANIRLRELRIGGFVLKDVAAFVTPTPMENPLLGTTVLRFLFLEFRRGACLLSYS
jgi:clan AA aspartic protease (TIGR02281 family)